MNLTQTQKDLEALVRGLADVLPNGETMFFRRSTITGPELSALIAPLLSAFEAVDDVKSLYDLSVVARRALEPVAAQLLKDAKKGADVTFGGTPDFDKLGFKPPKQRIELTPEQKALKTERLRATRKARGTLGSRQKKAVKGVVPSPPPQPD